MSDTTLKTTTKHSFNVRVYGIWINPKNEVLTTLEEIKGKKYSKFPGGGLEFGEGTIDCLKREWNEELGKTFDQCTHFYTTDFYQQSAFNPYHQIISIYYQVYDNDFYSPIIPPINELIIKSFAWLPINNELIDKMSFPIDKIVAEILINNLK